MPPSSATPTSKETRVRVDGLSKISATERPASESAPTAARPAFSSAARSSSAPSRSEISSPVRKSGAIEARDLTAAAVGLRIIGPAMEVRVLSWNLFHGTGLPAGEGAAHVALAPARARPSAGREHAQVNRDLFDAFAGVLAGAEWDVALLQECPPRWAERLATECRAEPHLVPTSRNIPRLGGVQARAADFNPDLIASWEGGSNLTLVRAGNAPGPAIAERRMEQLASRPERRMMAFTRLGSGLCVANLHASAKREAAERELPRRGRRPRHRGPTARLCCWAATSTCVPRSAARSSTASRADHGLVGADRARSVIDHLLASGAEVLEPARQWSPPEREVPDPTAPAGAALPIRLSDHAPVELLLDVPD